MDDTELNRKLAEAMGFELGTNKLGYNLSGPDTVLANKEDYFIEVHYQDPAIFAENVKWLLSHGISIDATWEETMPRYFAKAIAMARIKAGEV